MRFLSILLLSLFSLSLAAKKSAGDKFAKYQALAGSSTPFEIDDAAYTELTSSPRDYSVAILLTALDTRFGCKLCKDFQPEWEVLAKSWLKGDRRGDNRMLYTTLDFAQGKETFQKLQLQTAPVLLLFTPTIGPGAKPDGQPVRYDFSGDVAAEQIHGWITRHLPDGNYPPLKRPINWTRIGVSVTVLIGLVTFGTVAYPYLLPVIQNRNLWAGVSLVLVLMFTSGHMFNHIRKVPYVAGDGRGGVSYFAGGFSNQYGMETQIVASMYAVLSFGTIALALQVPRMKDARTQQVAVIIWASVILAMYSFLMNTFRFKQGGYPFWLPPFF